MKQHIHKTFGGKLDIGKGRIKVLGISSSKRARQGCAKEDPVSLWYLKIALGAARKAGAETKLIDLRDLKIGACNECYSTNPAQCRFNESVNQCDCYLFKTDRFFTDRTTAILIEKAYDKLDKKEFLKALHDGSSFAEGDDMWKIYEAMRWADGIIFATATNFYGRPALLQTMFSRLCALDGGVEELWGDGKNLQNSIKYSKNPKAKFKQRLYGKWCAFINCSKEGDSVTPNLMKACSMMGMNIIPFSVAYRVNWYDDQTFRSDTPHSKKDRYSTALAENIGREIVERAERGPRKYGIYSEVV